MTTTSRGATLLIGSPSGLRKPGEQVLDGKVGHVPQLDVRAGAVAHRREPAAFDPVAPQFRVAQAGLLDRGRDAAPRGTQDSDVGAGGGGGGGGREELCGETGEERVDIPAPYDAGRMVGIASEGVPHVRPGVDV